MGPTPQGFSRIDLLSVLHSLPTGVTLTGPDGRIVFSNTAADRMLGVSAAIGAAPDEWAKHYGVFLSDGETPFPTEQYPLVRALSGERTHDVEMLVRNGSIPGGAIISVSGQPLESDDGALKGAAVVFRDVTALRRAERLRDELASFIVHDLKSPLATISAACDLMELRGLGGELRRYTLAIREAADRMHRMVVDLLDIQLAEDGALQLELARTPLAALLNEVAAAAEARLADRNQRAVVGEAHQLFIVGDAQHLFRVLMNLVDNCAKYGPRDGLVTIDATPPDHSGKTVIRVSDEGPGVPLELRERIFEKYARAERAEGMRTRDSRGLGLRYCKVIVEAHGGRIWVENAEPTGARFCVELRVA